MIRSRQLPVGVGVPSQLEDTPRLLAATEQKYKRVYEESEHLNEFVYGPQQAVLDTATPWRAL